MTSNENTTTMNTCDKCHETIPEGAVTIKMKADAPTLCGDCGATELRKTGFFQAVAEAMNEAEEEIALTDAVAEAEAEREDAKTGNCCLCDGRYENWGNNPYPLCDKADYESRCCQACNDTKVIPARMMDMFKKDYLKKKLKEAKAMRRLGGRR